MIYESYEVKGHDHFDIVTARQRDNIDCTFRLQNLYVNKNIYKGITAIPI